MQTATKTVHAIYRFATTERLFFPSKPSRETRLALRAAGWKWDQRGMWYRHHSTTEPIKPKQLEPLLIAANDNEPDSNDVIAAAIA